MQNNTTLPKYYKRVKFYVGDKEKIGYLEPSSDIKNTPYFISEKDNNIYSANKVYYWEYY